GWIKVEEYLLQFFDAIMSIDVCILADRSGLRVIGSLIADFAVKWDGAVLAPVCSSKKTQTNDVVCLASLKLKHMPNETPENCSLLPSPEKRNPNSHLTRCDVVCSNRWLLSSSLEQIDPAKDLHPRLYLCPFFPKLRYCTTKLII
ncbi:unnamed protein product, partial [Ilex paraguariensis]